MASETTMTYLVNGGSHLNGTLETANVMSPVSSPYCSAMPEQIGMCSYSSCKEQETADGQVR